MKRIIDFVALLGMVQEHISAKYSAALTETDKISQLRSYIEKYLRDTEYTVEGLTTESLVGRKGARTKH